MAEHAVSVDDIVLLNNTYGVRLRSIMTRLIGGWWSERCYRVEEAVDQGVLSGYHVHTNSFTG